MQGKRGRRRLIIAIVVAALLVAAGGVTLLVWPRGVPVPKMSDVPVYPGAQDVQYQTGQGVKSPTGATGADGLYFTTHDSMDAVFRFYEDWLAKEGWELAGSTRQESGMPVEMYVKEWTQSNFEWHDWQLFPSFALPLPGTNDRPLGAAFSLVTQDAPDGSLQVQITLNGPSNGTP